VIRNAARRRLMARSSAEGGLVAGRNQPWRGSYPCRSSRIRPAGSLSQGSPQSNPALLTPATRLRLQEILGRIGRDEQVSLQERIVLQKFADRDASVASWLRRANRRQRGEVPADGIDRLLDEMNLGPSEPGPPYRPGEDDIEDWFGDAPDWLRRS
jgi:hypothetical protein